MIIPIKLTNYTIEKENYCQSTLEFYLDNITIIYQSKKIHLNNNLLYIVCK
jgi:hypothetical protein